ncbi:MAG: glycosyltransferase family 39 protein [Halofilum sp. (in: g-proteobacteria)]
MRHSTLVVLIALAVGIKLALAALIPLTGDEAYFLQYARNVDWGGFYDHPPMVGWMLWLTERIGAHPLVLRSPAIATGLLLPWLTYRLLCPADARRAQLVALLLLYTPIFLIFVFITTDVGVVLFGFLSLFAVHRGRERGDARWLAAGGAFLGLAFLSKYFAVLLGAAYAFHWLMWDRRNWRGLAIVLLVALPFGLLNLAWNWLHCWDNVMFNVFNRNSGGDLSLGGPALYLATLVYLFAFPLWWVARQRHDVYAAVRRLRLGLFASVVLAPLGLFALISLFAEVGLHWLLLFVPAAYPMYAGLSVVALRRALVLMVGFAFLHVAALLALTLPPVSVFAGTALHRDAVVYLAPEAFARAIPEMDVDFQATNSYSRSAVLSYYDETSWSVFGTGSKHARLDDRLSDWRSRDGGTMLYTEGTAELSVDELEPYFDAIELHRIEAGGLPFAVAVARGFDYARYRQDVLARIRERYYQIPGFLPVGGCPFLERYFPETERMSAAAHAPIRLCGGGTKRDDA